MTSLWQSDTGAEMAEPALERLDSENSSLLKWMAYAADWENHRDLDDELTSEEMGAITEEIEYEIEKADGYQIRNELAEFWMRGENNLKAIAADALYSINVVLDHPMRNGGSYGTISTHIVPWNHHKLYKDDWLDCGSREGLCTRIETIEHVGFAITLSSDTAPATVLHEVAHVLAFGYDGRFFHGPRWLRYFLLLIAGRYWELDLSEFMLELHDGRRPLTGSGTGSCTTVSEKGAHH